MIAFCGERSSNLHLRTYFASLFTSISSSLLLFHLFFIVRSPGAFSTENQISGKKVVEKKEMF